MAHVTAISPTKRNPQRGMIRVDGKVVATMYYKHIEELGITVGMPWTDAVAEEVSRKAAVDKAMRAAMKRLERRMMSRRDLFMRLRKLEHAAEDIDAALDRMTELGLIDDEAFGRALLRDMQMRKAAGPQLARQKLFQKGIDQKLSDRLIGEFFSDADQQLTGAMDLARKKLRTLERFDAATQKRRLWGMLARRGFAGDIINRAIARVLDDDEVFDD